MSLCPSHVRMLGNRVEMKVRMEWAVAEGEEVKMEWSWLVMRRGRLKGVREKQGKG